jgi:hypothetical protein
MPSVRSSTPSAMPKFRGACGRGRPWVPTSGWIFLEELEGGSPNAMSEMAVRTMDMRVRSVLMQVRWKERRVPRDEGRNVDDLSFLPSSFGFR